MGGPFGPGTVKIHGILIKLEDDWYIQYRKIEI